MSTTVESEGVPTDDLEVGDVVVVSRSIGELEERTFATVVDVGQDGPLVAGPGIETATLARALQIDSVTRYDEVIGQDETGAFHLHQRCAFFHVLDVLDEPGTEPAPRKFLRKGTVEKWIRFVDERRGWTSIPERYRDILEGGDRR
ncbi:hypothetical protein [Haloplanus sp. C73]|uniref:hypothetical protein n=1 Tax=Haloplanus sp. C73 TaxID=3421641 RepID=UPI003EB8330D